MKALNINSSHSPTKFLQPASLTTYTILSLSVQSTCRTRSSSAVTIVRPSVPSSLLITNRSFKYTSPYLWNQLPFFIPSTAFCSLSSWFTSSCAYHLITVTTFALTIYHSLSLLHSMLFSEVGQCRYRWKCIGCAVKHCHSRGDQLDIFFRRKVITTSAIRPPSWDFWVKEASGEVCMQCKTPFLQKEKT